MQNYKKFLLAAAVSMAFSASAMAETLKMGIEAAYPPFNNKDASGNVVGFDKDIGDALCAKMKVEKCEVYVSDWDGIIPALNAKKFDFLVSSLSITDERKQAVDFTDPYYSNKLQFIAPKATADFKTDAAYLKGKIIGAQRATLAGTYLEDKLPDTDQQALRHPGKRLPRPDVRPPATASSPTSTCSTNGSRAKTVPPTNSRATRWSKATRSVSPCAKATRCANA